MFARVKKSGKYQYQQIVENRKVKGKVKQRVIATVGRMDRLQEKNRVETLIRSLSHFSEKAMLILSGQSDVSAEAVALGRGSSGELRSPDINPGQVRKNSRPLRS